MKKYYLVSICIPTYNRSGYLKNSIESILCQKEFMEGKVEVVISDNASTDGTQLLGEKYAAGFEHIRYFRNEINVRDKNFPLVLSRASGTLRKLCNDSLLFQKGSLKVLCDVAEKYCKEKPFLYFSNRERGKKSIEKETGALDFRNFMLRASYRITWIGAFSIWGDECYKLENDTAGCDLLLWQVRKGCELASQKNRAVIIDGRLFTVQEVKNKDISYGLYQIFYVNYMKLLEPYFSNGSLTEKDRDYLEKDLLYHFFTSWIIQWELRNKNFKYSKEENLKERVFCQYKSRPYWRHYCCYYHVRKMKYRLKEILKKNCGKNKG